MNKATFAYCIVHRDRRAHWELEGFNHTIEFNLPPTAYSKSVARYYQFLDDEAEAEAKQHMEDAKKTVEAKVTKRIVAEVMMKKGEAKAEKSSSTRKKAIIDLGVRAGESRQAVSLAESSFDAEADLFQAITRFDAKSESNQHSSGANGSASAHKVLRKLNVSKSLRGAMPGTVPTAQPEDRGPESTTQETAGYGANEVEQSIVEPGWEIVGGDEAVDGKGWEVLEKGML